MSRKPSGAQKLLAGTSIAAIILGLTAAPAHAQLAAMRAAAGTIAPPIAAPVSAGTPARSATMQDALARQLSLQTRAQALATYVTSAKSAALASIRATPTDGISNAGLNPIQAVRAATIYVAAGVDAATVRGNLAPLSVAAVNDPTGQNTWEGSLAPVQSTASNGKVTVRIDQTQQRSLLSWQNFDVGTNTVLVFNQKLNGAAQKGWTVVNRVANATRPSTILGSVTADGTVLVLNRSGVLFGPQSQVNLHSLVASSLELGNFASSATTVGASTFFNAATLKERVTGYLQNGLLVQGVSGFKGQLLSSSLAAGQYDVNQPLPLAANPEGDVLVYQGATITTDNGGFIILAGPTVQNAGTLSAIDGQVSLQGGRFIGAVTSTGASGSADENVRGLILSSQLPNVPLAPQAPTPDQGVVINSGLIVSRRGYISLGTDLYGQVTNDGLLSATTSVSRNGKILLTGGTVRLAGSDNLNQASGITILPDNSGETIPQGSPNSPPAFKSSQIAIGNSINSYLVADGTGDVALMPTLFSMETNSFILAPNAKVVIGHDVAAGIFQPNPGVAASVTIADKAIIDVSGVKGVARNASDNSVRISPAKQNELRDTPNYRPVRTDGGFTLNGATLFVDARASGVRDDGVAWVGSPLLEAASAVSQIPVSAAELMTKGGNISIDVGAVVGATNLSAIAIPPVIIARGAIFDISGGWTTYASGVVLTSQLLTSDGRVVGIGQADQNDIFVDLISGFTAEQVRLGISQNFVTRPQQSQIVENAYDEGRDAGALQIGGSQIVFDATVHANAFAGSRQLASAIAPSRNSAIAGDPRKLQFAKNQLPSGGLLRIGSFSGSSGVGFGQDIVVYRGLKTGPADVAELLLDERMLSNAGLSGLVLQTSGAVTLAAATDRPLTIAAALAITGDTSLQLADGGVLEIDAGRQIRFNGNVRIAGGSVAARTYQLSDINAAGISTVGNPFRSDDDILVSYASGAVLPNPFDLTVNGTLSVAGKWVNDYQPSANPQGPGWINGGSIALTVAPKVIVPVDGDVLTASAAADISGSIRINTGALLDVSAGAYVSNARRFNLSASGGNISLINETIYATVAPLQNNVADLAGSLVRGQSVAFTPKLPTPTTIGVTPSLVPVSQTSVVKFAAGTLRGFGFSGGGNFKLVSPNVAIGAGGGAGGDPGATYVPLDFLQTTGFGALDLTTYRSRIVRDLFDNGSTRLSSFLETTRFVVGAGQTLDLTQVTLPNVLDVATQGRLLNLASGESLTGLLTPAIPSALWYRKSASLLLRGLTELSVEAGGAIIGAPQAVIVAPKLYNAGRIDLPGGTIRQIATLPEAFNFTGIGLTDIATGGSGFDAVFGPRGASGRYAADGFNAAGLLNTDGSVKTNNEIFTTPGNEQFLYFVGRVAANDGIVLAAGSITNLGGIAITNPDAPLRADGSRYTFGRLLAGGSITTAAAYNPSNDVTQALFPNPTYGVVAYPDPTSTSPSPPPLLAQTAARRFVARPGAVLDISGATGTFDVAVSANQYAPSLQWSDAGNVALRGGGTLSGAIIRARGGNSSAAGGTLEWLMPTIRAADDGLGAPNVAFADGIARAGFDTLIASGGLTLDGAFTLSLRKALLVRSPVSLDGTPVGPNADVTISATLGTIAAIEAPYIAFASRSGFLRNSAAASGNAAITFAAGALGMDFFGSTLFDRSIAQTNLFSAADVRLIGVDDRADTTQAPVLNGSLISAGNLTFDAARVYTTTGTGNLQRILENAAGATNTRTPLPFQLSALGGSTITFLGNRINTAAPLSAGSFLQINARSIVQNGYLAAPLGRISFGSAENPVGAISFGANSVTAVSGAGLNVPYGTTTDLSQLFFTPGSASPLTQLPSGNLRVIADTIDFAAGSKVIGSGGGDVFAYEFVSGTGGSRDVLSRFNSDVFSSNSYNPATGQGLQYADGRQVYALVPSMVAAKIAMTDPVYSADYGLGSPTDLYGTSAGLAVTIDGGGGLAAGQYVLMPAHYALLPGAYRIVENVDAAVPASGIAQTLLDGSTVLGGVYSTAGTNLVSSQRRSFTLQSQASFLRYSSLRTTGGTATIQRAAASAGITAPRLPLDAARVVLDPLKSLTVAGFFDMTPAAGGRGSTVDILGESIFIDRSGASSAAGLVLSSTSLANLNANSLMIGGERIENADGTTRLGITASRITVASGADIKVPELILAVAGAGSTINIRDGASITATGTLADTRAGDYVIPSTSTPANGDPFDQSGVGSVFRLSAGPQRAVSRLGAFAAANAGRNSQLNIGQAAISGNSLLLNTNFRFSIDETAALAAPLIAISAANLSFGARGTISAALEQQLARAAELRLSTAAPITFDAGTVHSFNRLTIDAPGIALTGQTGGADALTINAGDTRISNSRLIADVGCAASGVTACGTTGNALNLNLASLTLGSGSFNTYSFDGAVNLTARAGTYIAGSGALQANGAALRLATPFVIDRAAVVDLNSTSTTPSDQITPRGNYTIPVTPNYNFATKGAVLLTAAGTTSAAPAGIRAPGAHISFGAASAPIAAITIDGTAITATSGVIDIRSNGSITLAGAASLATPGFSRKFGDDQSTTTISAGAGTVNLVSLTGNIVLPATSSLITDTGIGSAGRLNLYAAQGAIDLRAALNSAVTGARAGSFTFDAGTSAFDLDGFALTNARKFQGDLSIRSGAGNLALSSGSVLRAANASLTADGGSIIVGGTIDTSGVSVTGLTPSQLAAARISGGNVALWGRDGVALNAGALIDAHTSGYADTDQRQASAGDVTIGIGNTGGAIAINAGSTIDLGARRTQAALAANTSGNRLVRVTVKDADTLVNTDVFQFVSADQGGALSLRAPIIGDAMDKIDVRLKGAVIGAGSRQIEAYRRYDIDQISGLYDGISSVSRFDVLDPTPTGFNILSDVFVDSFDGTQSIPYFIQNFAVSAADGSNLAGIRLRPGVDLVSSRSIFTVGAWNLAAGTLNVSAARAAGLIIDLPQLGPRLDGSAYYALKPGSESEILSNHVSFLYRVGGKPSGEAGVFTIKAANNIDIIRSISDGFFNFADKSDAAYINYALGGGDRAYNVALLTSCGSGLNCANVANYADINAGTVLASANNAVTINLTRFLTGREQVAGPTLAPYNPEANLAAALGNNLDPISGDIGGDALGFAQLFPRLNDGSAIHSSSLRLVAGASDSANPLHIDRASAGNLTVQGETAYALSAFAGTASIGTGLDLKLAIAGLTNAALPAYGLNELLGTTDGNGNVSQLTGDAYTQITWGGAADGGLADSFRAAAQRYFTSGNAQFTSNSRGVVEGVAAPLADMLAFLQTIAPDFAQNVAGQTPGYPIGTPTSPAAINFGARAAYARTLIRTGDGSIAVAASGNIDLRNGAAAVYRNENGTTVSSGGGAQVGGTAIYTAGVRLSAQAVTARVADTGAIVSITPDSNYLGFAAQDSGFLPSPKGLDDQAAVLADGGGSLWVEAGGSVLARRDEWSERFLNRGAVISGSRVSSYNRDAIGDAAQRWRPGVVGQDTEIAIAPKYFTSGLGALAGGDITLAAGGSVSDLTLALDAATTTTRATSGLGSGLGAVSLTLGRGDLSATIGGDLGAGQIDVANGAGQINVSGNVISFGRETQNTTGDAAQYLRIRLARANVMLAAQGAINLAGVSALGAARSDDSAGRYNQAGFFTPTSSFSAIAAGALRYANNRLDQVVPFQIGTGGAGAFGGSVLPPTLTLAALTSTLSAPSVPLLLYPSKTGNLQLFSAGDIASLVITMSDSDPSLLAGAFSAARINLDSINATGAGNVTASVGLGFGIPGVGPTTSEYLLRLYHNENTTHAGDIEPARIFAGNDIRQSLINVPKAVQILAGRDIVNLFFTGQNANAQDTTIISAARDITSTTATSSIDNLPYLVSNNFILGGGGNLVVQAGRDIGPFINSAVVRNVSYAGGIQTVGNFYNPWLGDGGANLSVLFGIAGGVNYTGLRESYLNPANFADLDRTLFVLTPDSLGIARPDRTRPIYAPILANWLKTNDPAGFQAIFGGASFPDTAAGTTALANAAYPQSAALYAAFVKLDPLLQNQFLVKQLLFSELQQPARPDGPSFLQYYRGYRAVQTLFPVSSGYTDNLAVYTTDPTTISADSPQGLPTRNLVNGQPQTAQTIATGNADLRLATIQTVNGGDLSILGPGGNFIAGSVVRTSTQVAQRVTRFGVDQAASLAYGQLTNSNAERISAIPIGFEGVLTLNGGAVSGFVDGNFLVNQSRVFTQAGGDITLWSSNGDLNAGQGPRSASNFPPVTVRFNLDGFSQVDSAGSVSGAGIGAFQRRPTDPTSSIILVAPAGEVDAGDAGVRATGNVLVAAARVANSDGFSAGGAVSGVPGQAAVAVTVAPTSAASAVASQNTGSRDTTDTSNRRSVISVDVLGFADGTPACDPNDPSDPDCRPPVKPN